MLDLKSFGESMDETKLKNGLRTLNPDIHFDMGACLGKYHPHIDRWQGIFLYGKHICSMDRGAIPEYNVWALAKMPDGTEERSHALRIGWRHTLHFLTLRQVPGMTWENFKRVFGVDKKDYISGESVLPAAEAARNMRDGSRIVLAS